MKKFLTLALVALMALSASAAKKKEATKNANKPVFTTIKENPITSVKDQNRSGTCWDYSTLSFFEAEILKATGKTYDLDESFVANKTYMERAIQVVRFHGDCQFAQGGSAEDVLATMKAHGIIPQGIMPFPGSLYGDSLNNFNEFFSILEPYVDAVAKNKAKKISNAWKNGLQGILDAYLGKCPEKFTYEGKEYTPKSLHRLCRRGTGQLALPTLLQRAHGRDDADYRQRRRAGLHRSLGWRCIRGRIHPQGSGLRHRLQEDSAESAGQRHGPLAEDDHREEAQHHRLTGLHCS